VRKPLDIPGAYRELKVAGGKCCITAFAGHAHWPSLPMLLEDDVMNVGDGALRHGRTQSRLSRRPSSATGSGLARVLAFLASDDADYVRGTVSTR
jgi:hypothetical protein